MFTPASKLLTISILTSAILFTGCGGGDSSDTTAPKFSTATLNTSVVEGTQNVLTLKAEDSSDVTYAISGGADAGLFTIDAKTGALSLKTPLDFNQNKSADGDRTFEVIITATDTAGNSASQTVLVKLTTSDTQAPFISTPATVEVAKSTKEVIKIEAQDQNEPLSYTILEEGDGALFTIDNEGNLAFKKIPTYIKGGDNTYKVTIEVSDAVENSTKHTITVTVTDPKVVLTTGIPGEPGVARDWIRTPEAGDRAVVTLKGNTIMWEDNIDTQSGGDAGNYIYRHKTFAAAKQHCDELVLGGYDDWRLPTPNELQQLVNHSYVGNPDKYMDDAFHFLNLTFYWSSVELNNGTARVLNLVLGTDDEMDKNEDDGNNVRCVRGELSKGDFVADNTNHTVTDLSTGLIWDNSADIGAKTYNHAEAIAACEAKGMRLPTINELITLADYENEKIRIPNPAGADALYFWASTPALYEDKKYRYFSFDKAVNEFGSKTNDDFHEMYIRCVKSK